MWYCLLYSEFVFISYVLTIDVVVFCVRGYINLYFAGNGILRIHALLKCKFLTRDCDVLLSTLPIGAIL
jgi:hypothetical protein